MGIFVIGDEETVLGFKLINIDGKKARNQDEASKAFKIATANPDIKLIIINEKIAETIKSEINQYTEKHLTPSIIEVPDKDGPVENRLSIEKLIKTTVGLKI